MIVIVHDGRDDIVVKQELAQLLISVSLPSIFVIVSHQAIDCLLFCLLLLLKRLLVQWVRLNDPIVTLELGCDSVLRPDVVVVLEQDADVAA